MSYLMLEWLHMLGAAVLLGTGIGIAFFAWFGYRQALRSGELALLRGVLRLTVMADFAFTAPAVVLQLATGLALWSATGQRWSHGWLWTVLGLYAFVGACWLPVVVLQLRLRNLAESVDEIDALPPRFHALFRRWFMLGVPAFVGVLGLTVLMIWRGAWW